MKEIRETKLVEQTTVKFIAVDGKEFTDEKECLAHERRLDQGRVKRAFEKLIKEKFSFDFINYFMGDNNFYILDLERTEDFYTVEDYFTINNYFDIDLTEPEKFPATILVFDHNDYVDQIRNIDEFKTNITKILDKLNTI